MLSLASAAGYALFLFADSLPRYPRACLWSARKLLLRSYLSSAFSRRHAGYTPLALNHEQSASLAERLARAATAHARPADSLASHAPSHPYGDLTLQLHAACPRYGDTVPSFSRLTSLTHPPASYKAAETDHLAYRYPFFDKSRSPYARKTLWPADFAR